MSKIPPFSVPFRQVIRMGPHSVRVTRITHVELEIDGKKYMTKHSCFEFKGYTIRTRVEDGRVDLYLPADLRQELGIQAAEPVAA